MEISKKDIKCKGVVEKIERLSISIQKFIELVNRNLPDEFKLKEEKLIIERKDDKYNFLDDGNTTCPGYSYKIFWGYTFGNVNSSKEKIINLTQSNAVTFMLDCGERCYDHRQNRLYFFSIYFKDSNLKNEAERIDYINDNYDENHLFKPYELMQVTWRIKKALNLLPNNISENYEDFKEFAKNFENEKITFEPDNLFLKLEKNYPEEVWHSIEEFKETISDFIFILNCYCAVSSKKMSVDSLKRYLKGEYDDLLEKAIEDFSSKTIYLIHEEDIMPTKFLWTKDSHNTYNDNEKWNSFLMYDCLKVICGYSYFNGYFFSFEGVLDNWYPRLLYFSYYISSDLKTVYYTISMTSCEGRFRKDYMNLIEATTLKELLSPENIIKVAKWLEEICEKTSYIYHYSSVIQEENIENFFATNEID